MQQSTILMEMNTARLHKIGLLKGCAEKVLQSTVQFFFDNPKPKYYTAGSGVLFEINSKYFIFTAAHVFTKRYEKIYVISNQEAISLGGMLYTTPLLNSGDRRDDKIDLAILEISNKIADKLKADYYFIKLNDLELGHYIDVDTNYLIAGYPITKTKKVWGIPATLKSQPFVANLDALIRFDYGKFKFSFASHIAMDYNGEMISLKNQNSHLAPNLEGISGSGLWYLNNFPEEELFKSKLIGIIIEQIKENGNKSIIATRIDIVILLVNKLLNLSIPIPKKVNKYQ